MPATVAAGDLLICLFAYNNGNPFTSAVSTPSGWTSLEHTTMGTGQSRFALFAKVAAGTEGGTTVGFTTNNAEQAAVQVYRIPAASWEGTLAGGIDSAATSGTANPPSLAPGWGTEDILWIAAVSGDNAASNPVSGYPSNYGSGEDETTAGGTIGGWVGSARRELSAGSEDPGTFTVATGGQTLHSITIAVRPAAVQPTATAAVALPSATSASTATHTLTATGAASLPSPTASGSASHTISATGAASLPSLTGSASATHTSLPEADAAVTLPSLTAAGTATHSQSATAAVTLPSLTGAATALAGTPITVTIEANDDAYQVSDGTVTLDDFTALVDAVDEWHGFRFTGIAIPNGATITAAHLSVVPSSPGLDEPSHTIYGVASDDSTAFTTSSSDISSRTQTSASALWDEATLGATGDSRHMSPDISDIITEIVERPGWAEGNALSLVMHGSADASRDLGIYMSEIGTFSAPRISITYLGTGISATTTGTLPALTAAATATHTISATGAASLPSLTSASAAHMEPVATAAATLPALAGAATATQTFTATAAATLPSLTSSSSAAKTDPPVATAAVVLPSLMAAATATETHPQATAEATLPTLVAAIASTHELTATSAVTLPFPSAALAANSPTTGIGASSLPFLTAASSASWNSGRHIRLGGGVVTATTHQGGTVVGRPALQGGAVTGRPAVQGGTVEGTPRVQGGTVRGRPSVQGGTVD